MLTQLTDLPQTLSLNQSWAIGATVPSGYIQYISVAVYEPLTVAVNSMTCKQGELSIVLTGRTSDGNSVLLLSATTREQSSVVPMYVHDAELCAGAVMHTGCFTDDVSAVYTEDNAPVLVCGSVYVVPPAAPTVPMLTVNGVTSSATVMELLIDDAYYSTHFDEEDTQRLIITVPDDKRELFHPTDINIIDDDTVVRTINGIRPDEQGDIKINIACANSTIQYPLTSNAQLNGNTALCTLVTSPAFLPLCTFEDVNYMNNGLSGAWQDTDLTVLFPTGEFDRKAAENIEYETATGYSLGLYEMNSDMDAAASVIHKLECKNNADNQ